jgi:hypothetical protein
MDPPAHLLALAPPSETNLLSFATSRVSREMIHEIAMNDRGENSAAYELGISRQLAPKPTLGLVTWTSIGEVLWLEQVSEPQADRGHAKRLFACTILLRNVAYVSSLEEGDADLFVDHQTTSVIQLVRSAVALGNQPCQLALGFLLWVHSKQSHPVLRPFAAFGALLLEIQASPSKAEILETLRWVTQEETLARMQPEGHVHSPRWLLGLSWQADSRKNRDRWIDTFAQVLAARSEHLSPDVQSTLGRLTEALSR